MGFFKKIKDIFNNAIEKTPEMDNYLLSLYNQNKTKIKINKKINVEVDWLAIFVVGDKVCDVLTSGTYQLNNLTLPIVFKRARLDKVNKKGKGPKKFCVDIYFANLHKLKDVSFRSCVPFLFRSQQFGKVKGYFEGSMDIRLLDSITFLKTLLLELPYIRTGYAMKVLMYWVSEEVNDIIYNSEIIFDTLITNPRQMYNIINTEISAKMEDYGVEVSNVKINSMILPKKVEKKISDFITENKHTMQDIAENLLEEKTDEVLETLNPDVATSLNDFDVSQLEGPSFEEENKDLVGNINNEVSLRRGQTKTEDLVQKPDIEIESKIDISQEFQEVTDKKQCKYCDKMIGVEFAYCPFCGFKQD